MLHKERKLLAKHIFLVFFNQENTKVAYFFKNANFKCIFVETVSCREVRFFALHSVHKDISFELSKRNSFDLWGV